MPSETTETTTERRSLRCDMVFTMLSALHHGQGSDGNVSLFRTGRHVVDGEVMDLPYLSGNSLKHNVIRVPGVQHMLRVLDVPDGGLSRPVVHLLWSGGALTTKGSTVDLGAYRALCEMVPIIALCGAAVGNYMVESRLSVGDARPVCVEHASRIPLDRLRAAGLVRHDPPPVSHLYDVQLGTRHDPLRSEGPRRYLAPPERTLLDDGKSAALAKREVGEHVEKGDSQQMLYERQVLAAGTQLHATLYTRDLTRLEEAALWSAVGEWLREPFIGAQRSVGNGHADLRILPSEPIALRYPEWRDTDAPLPAGASVEGRAADAMLGEYEDHLRAQRDEILATLGKAAA